jgi:hypothetical protein
MTVSKQKRKQPLPTKWKPWLLTASGANQLRTYKLLIMETLIKKYELRVKELEKLGLYQDGLLNLASEDIDVLLAGRRTDIRSMIHLKVEGFSIQQLDAKHPPSAAPMARWR